LTDLVYVKTAVIFVDLYNSQCWTDLHCCLHGLILLCRIFKYIQHVLFYMSFSCCIDSRNDSGFWWSWRHLMFCIEKWQ